MDVKQIERLEALPDEWRKRAQEAEDDGLFTAADAIRYCAHELSRDLPALLQLARAVSEAHVAVLHEADDDRGHEWLECRLELGWEQHKAMAGQTVALVPVTVKEGIDAD